MHTFARLATLALAPLLLCGVGQAQQTADEPVPRSTLLNLALPDAPRRITGGLSYTTEIVQMGKGALSWELGTCAQYELLYWTTALKVKPKEAAAHFLAATQAAGWGREEVFAYDPLQAFVLSKNGRRVLASYGFRLFPQHRAKHPMLLQSPENVFFPTRIRSEKFVKRARTFRNPYKLILDRGPSLSLCELSR